MRVGAIPSATPGAIVLADNDSRGTIRVTSAALSGTWGPVDQTVVHEIGHNWDDENLDWAGFLSLSGWEVWDLTANPTVKTGYTQATDLSGSASNLYWTAGGHTYCWIYRTGMQFSRSDGYGRTNPYEDFATCVETYYALAQGYIGANPASNWQAKWNFINTFLTD